MYHYGWISVLILCSLVAGCTYEADNASAPPTAKTTASRPTDLESAATRTEEVGDQPVASGVPPAGPVSAGPTIDHDRETAAGKSRTATSDTATSDEATIAPDPTPRPKKPQSGILTAGSFDDVEHFETFKKFLTDAMQRDSGGQLPTFPVGRQLVIHVTNSRGQPVGGADVSVTTPSQQDDGKTVRLTTGSDGRAMLLTGTDTGGKEKVTIAVTLGDSKQVVRKTVVVDQGVCTIQLPQVNVQLPKQLDLALVIDATGSMGDELSYLKSEIDSIAQTVNRMFPNVDQRYALVVYRDNGDQYVSKTFDFTSSLSEFRATLAAQHADGGGDYPEAMHIAMEQASQLDWRDGNTARVLFLVADAPPHDQHSQRTLEVATDLRELGVRIYPVASSGVQLKAELVMRASALLTMGEYLFLTDHSGVGNPHAAPHVPEYAVERLDRMMVRMVAQELAGKRLVPKEVLAIERGDWQPSVDQIEQASPQQTRAAPGALPSTDSSTTVGSLRWLALAVFVTGAFFVDAVDRRRRARYDD